MIRKTVQYARAGRRVHAPRVLGRGGGADAAVRRRWHATRADARDRGAHDGVFLWLRPRATRLANRLVYGKRATPYEVLSEFSERVGETYSTDDVLPRMAQLVPGHRRSTGRRVAARGHRSCGRKQGGRPTSNHRPNRRIRGDEIEPVRTTSTSPRCGTRANCSARSRSTSPADDPMNPAKEALVRDLAAQAGLVLRNVRPDRGSARVTPALGGGSGRGTPQARAQHPRRRAAAARGAHGAAPARRAAHGT